LVAASLVRAYLDKTSRLQGLFKFLGGFEIAVIALLLGSLIFFGCLQIVLRNFFHRGLLWADPLMRHTVLWLGCLGAVLATSKMRHINIDVFTRFLPPRIRAVRDRIISLVTAFATSVLGFAALKLVIDEKEFGETAFLNVDTWMLQAVLPVAFFLISYRSLFNTWCPRESKPMEWDEFAIDIDSGEATLADDDAATDGQDADAREPERHESADTPNGEPDDAEPADNSAGEDERPDDTPEKGPGG
jgi:TRAP-type C4-dicarboxylate transport system permease small subunit